MVMAPTWTKGTMMSTKMIFFKPSNYGLLKDTRDQDNGNYGVKPSENASQVIINQPILTNLVNGKITVKTFDMVLSSGIAYPFF